MDQQFFVYLQNFCREGVPATSAYEELHSGIVCGANLQHSDLKQLFQNTGLYHLLVVSGSHLGFIIWWLQKWRHSAFVFIAKTRILDHTRLSIVDFFWSLFSLSLVLLYALVTGLQAPVMRSLFEILVQTGARKLHVSMHAEWSLLLAGLLCLYLFPEWSDSLSLQLSWCASLALKTPFLDKRPHWRSQLQAHTFIYLILYLPFSVYTQTNPSSILFNFFFGPVLGLVLFPMCLINWFIHELTPWTDHIFGGLVYGLDLLNNPSNLTRMKPRSPQSTDWIWAYIAFIHIFMHFGRIYWNRYILLKERSSFLNSPREEKR